MRQPLEVQRQQAGAAVKAGYRLKNAIAEMQPAIER
jgi:hypothetical protein